MVRTSQISIGLAFCIWLGQHNSHSMKSIEGKIKMMYNLVTLLRWHLFYLFCFQLLFHSFPIFYKGTDERIFQPQDSPPHCTGNSEMPLGENEQDLHTGPEALGAHGERHKTKFCWNIILFESFSKMDGRSMVLSITSSNKSTYYWEFGGFVLMCFGFFCFLACFLLFMLFIFFTLRTTHILHKNSHIVISFLILYLQHI